MSDEVERIDYTAGMAMLLYENRGAGGAVEGSSPTREPLEFHRRLAGYEATRLVDLPELARRLGVSRLWVKDESWRLGLPSFKILGASWATYQALGARLGGGFHLWSTMDDLAAQLTPLRPMTLVAATAGNHGRAVARVAALFGLGAHIYVPAGTAEERIEAIASERAEVTVVDGTYDDAVRLSAGEAGEHAMVISDTSWPGYVEVPRWVIEGYSTIFWEIEDELERRGEDGPDLVVVQMGVGALAAAVVRHYRRPDLARPPRIAGVEPIRAACVLRSMEVGRIVELPGPHESIMAGLNCGLASEVAWPYVSSGIDLFVAIEDERARQGMRMLAAEGMVAGETGAAGVGGLIELLTGDRSPELRALLGLNEATRVLAICTEGATDPASYERIVGHAPDRRQDPI